MILKHFLIWAIIIDLAKMAKIHKFCLANSLLDSPMATWLTLTGTVPFQNNRLRPAGEEV